MMFLTDLLDRLEDLRISDGDFFGKDEATRYAYEKANDMLDNCLQIVHDYFGEHIYLNETIYLLFCPITQFSS